MRDSLLIPLDGTPIAEAGLSWAEAAAGKCGASLQLLSVCRRDSDAQALTATIDYLDRHVQRLRAGGIRATAQLQLGDPAPRILQEAECADLTVLTSGTTRWIVSPILDQILRKMESPVALVRGDRSEWMSATNLERILLPVSESNYSSEAIPVVQRLAMTFEAEVILLHNVSPPNEPGSAGESPFSAVTTKRIDVDLSQAESYVEHVADEFRGWGIRVRTVISTGEPAKQIVAVGREYGAGLIAMATRGRDRLESRIAGSVANVVLESTPIPCVLIRTAAPGMFRQVNGREQHAVRAEVTAEQAP